MSLSTVTTSAPPHGDTPTATAGRPVEGANAAPLAMILVHGRGGTAPDILSLAEHFPSEHFAYRAPAARGNTWYDYSFLAPMEKNEPGLSSGLARLGREVAELEAAGIPAERIVLLGFSQGACLALEFAARNARRYGAVVAFSGGLIGPEGTPRDYEGSFEGTPIFLGCSDRDAHIPLERVRESTAVLRRLGAEVEERIYPGMPHTIIDDEVRWAQNRVRELESAVEG